MAVPGVDMCNHSYQPNATVRLVHSPAACQGLDALEEVAPVAAAAACPSYFQLVAGKLLFVCCDHRCGWVRAPKGPTKFTSRVCMCVGWGGGYILVGRARTCTAVQGFKEPAATDSG